MKALAYAISMTVAAASASSALVPPAATADAAPCAATAAGAGYPVFCAIPQPPHDVRTPAQFKAAVLALRSAGRTMVRAGDAGGWSLRDGETTAFGEAAEAEAAAPPPMTPPGSDATDFARAAREAATPPPRPH
jgi:hypothetical protein